MKKIIYSVAAVAAIGTSVMAESYPAYGPDSYIAEHHEGPYAINNGSTNASGEPATYGTIDRQGFRLSLGAGVGYTSIDNYYWNGDDLSSTGVATSFEIGYAPTNQLSIQYMNNVNFGGSDEEYSGFSAIVLNYYLENVPDTVYLVGGIGGTRYDSYGDVEFTGIVGIGYAINKIEFEVDGAFNQYNDENMMQFFFTVSYRFF